MRTFSVHFKEMRNGRARDRKKGGRENEGMVRMFYKEAEQAGKGIAEKRKEDGNKCLRDKIQLTKSECEQGKRKVATQPLQ